MLLPAMHDVVDAHGEWLGDRPCSNCGQKKVHRVTYGDRKLDCFYACRNCDVDVKEKIT